MDFTLYRAVGNMNRVALGDLATHEYYAAEKNETTGRITLVPVNIVEGSKRGAAQTDTDTDTDADAIDGE